MRALPALHHRYLCRSSALSSLQFCKLSSRELSTTSSTLSARKWNCGYDCDIPAEPLYRYRPGGYHPVKIGDVFQDNRYRILQKLGWGGFSTIWAARDEKDQKNVALKIVTADHSRTSREVDIMLALEESKFEYPGSAYVRSLHDHFKIKGPNGLHECLVLEFLGPNVSDIIEKLRHQRLPATLAKIAARQALLGLEGLHQRGIVHGDLHVRNLACTLPQLRTCSEQDLDRLLGPPDIGPVRRRNREPVKRSMPEYLVSSAAFPQSLLLDALSDFKIIDMGESFFEAESPPTTLHTPLIVRSPEAIFIDRLDHRADLWGMGCLFFELVTGQPPFDNVMITIPSLIAEILDMTGDELPQRWRAEWQNMSSKKKTSAVNDDGEDDVDEKAPLLMEWLEEVYLAEKQKDAEFSRADLERIGDLVGRMVRVEPKHRAEARDILADPWFSG